MKKTLLIFTLILAMLLSITCAKKESGKISSFYSYPNPFNDANITSNQLFFRINTNVNYNFKIEIFTENGNLVKVLEGTGTSGIQNKQWNGTDDRGNLVKNGVYTSLLTLDEKDGSGNVIGTYQAFCYTVKN